MPRKITSPIMRLVQGSMSLQQERDDNGNLKFLDDGKPSMSVFFAGAIDKNNPEWDKFWGEIYAEALASFPTLVKDGVIQHPKFSFKYQDGDGVSSQTGQSVAGKPGFAGHHIIKFGSLYPPKCFYANELDPASQIQEPDKVIKKGHYIRVRCYVQGNGVDPTKNPSRVPGIYINPEIVLHEGFGPEIVSGEDPREAFKEQAGYRPAGMSAAPVGNANAPAPSGAPAPAPAPLPSGAPAPAPLPSGAPAPTPPAPPAGIPTPPPTAAVDPNAYTDPATNLRYIHTGTAGPYTVKQLIDVGWTIAALVQQQHARQI